MAQSYVPLIGSDLFSDSYTKLNSSDEALRTLHSGSSEPANTAPEMLWADTSSGILKQRNSGDDAWIDVALLGSDFGGALRRSGGTMDVGNSGIDMNSGSILNLPAPGGGSTQPARAVDLDAKAPLASPAFTGAPTRTGTPTASGELVDKNYVDSAFINKGGDTMTGALVLDADAATALEPITKQVHDSMRSNHVHDGIDAIKVAALNLSSGAATVGTDYVADGAGAMQARSLLAFAEAAIGGAVLSTGARDTAYPYAGSWTSVKASTGTYTLTFNGIFTAQPHVIAVWAGSAAEPVKVVRGYATSISQATVQTFQAGDGVAADTNFKFFIFG